MTSQVGCCCSCQAIWCGEGNAEVAESWRTLRYLRVCLAIDLLCTRGLPKSEPAAATTAAVGTRLSVTVRQLTVWPKQNFVKRVLLNQFGGKRPLLSNKSGRSCCSTQRSRKEVMPRCLVTTSNALMRSTLLLLAARAARCQSQIGLATNCGSSCTDNVNQGCGAGQYYHKTGDSYYLAQGYCQSCPVGRYQPTNWQYEYRLYKYGSSYYINLPRNWDSGPSSRPSVRYFPRTPRTRNITAS